MYNEGTKNQFDDDYDYLIKLLALGDSNVGKTSFLYQYTDGVFNPRFTSTVGVDFRQKRLIRESKDTDGVLGMRLRLHLQLWDTAGQERFRSLCTVFLRDAMGFLLVFDLTNEKSLMNCRDWMNLLCQHAYCDRPDVILVGNKADLSEERTVTLATATSMARQLGVPYIETSAATGHNVSKAIDMLLDAVMHRIEASVTKGKLHGALQVSNGNVLLHDGNSKRNKQYEEESTATCSNCMGTSFMNTS